MGTVYPSDDIEPREVEELADIPTEQTVTTAIIKVAPAEDAAIQALVGEARSILRYAQSRVITVNEDLNSATEDLSLIAKLKKAIEEKRKEYVGPIREKLDAVNSAFKEFTSPLEEADKVTRAKILEFRQEQERRRREAERIEQEKLELARREAELKGGEITVDLSPIEKPEAVPDKVHTGVGSAGTMKVRKWEIVDFAAVPDEYKTIDAGKVTKLVKAGIGAIPGIRIYEEETLRVNAR